VDRITIFLGRNLFFYFFFNDIVGALSLCMKYNHSSLVFSACSSFFLKVVAGGGKIEGGGGEVVLW
jgi:hypothetical protein